MKPTGNACFAAERLLSLPFSQTIALLALALGLAVAPLRSEPRHPGKQLPAKGSANSAAAAMVTNQYAKLPLSFEPNVGQSDPAVQYIARANGYSLFLASKETTFLLKASARRNVPAETSQFERGSLLRLQFLKSNLSSRMS